MDDAASPMLIELRGLHSNLSLLSCALRTVLTTPFNLREYTYQEHVYETVQACSIAFGRLKLPGGPRLNLVDILEQWEKGGLSDEMTNLVEQITEIPSREFTEVKCIFHSLSYIRQETLVIFKMYQWNYMVNVLLLQWKETAITLIKGSLGCKVFGWMFSHAGHSSQISLDRRLNFN